MVLTSASVVSQPSVLYLRRIHFPSYHQSGSSSLRRFSITSSARTGSFFSSAMLHLRLGIRNLAHDHAAADEEHLAGDERRLRRREERHRRPHVRGRPPAPERRR